MTAPSAIFSYRQDYAAGGYTDNVAYLTRPVIVALDENHAVVIYLSQKNNPWHNDTDRRPIRVMAQPVLISPSSATPFGPPSILWDLEVDDPSSAGTPIPQGLTAKKLGSLWKIVVCHSYLVGVAATPRNITRLGVFDFTTTFSSGSVFGHFSYTVPGIDVRGSDYAIVGDVAGPGQGCHVVPLNDHECMVLTNNEAVVHSAGGGWAVDERGTRLVRYLYINSDGSVAALTVSDQLYPFGTQRPFLAVAAGHGFEGGEHYLWAFGFRWFDFHPAWYSWRYVGASTPQFGDSAVSGFGGGNADYQAVLTGTGTRFDILQDTGLTDEGYERYRLKAPLPGPQIDEYGDTLNSQPEWVTRERLPHSGVILKDAGLEHPGRGLILGDADNATFHVTYSDKFFPPDNNFHTDPAGLSLADVAPGFTTYTAQSFSGTNCAPYLRISDTRVLVLGVVERGFFGLTGNDRRWVLTILDISPRGSALRQRQRDDRRAGHANRALPVRTRQQIR